MRTSPPSSRPEPASTRRPRAGGRPRASARAAEGRDAGAERSGRSRRSKRAAETVSGAAGAGDQLGEARRRRRARRSRGAVTVTSLALSAVPTRTHWPSVASPLTSMPPGGDGKLAGGESTRMPPPWVNCRRNVTSPEGARRARRPGSVVIERWPAEGRLTRRSAGRDERDRGGAGAGDVGADVEVSPRGGSEAAAGGDRGVDGDVAVGLEAQGAGAGPGERAVDDDVAVAARAALRRGDGHVAAGVERVLQRDVADRRRRCRGAARRRRRRSRRPRRR